MACSIWEEMGLLYSSGELNVQERQTFLEHVRGCTECTQELDMYQREREHLFSIDVLGEMPSAACDAEILRVCSDGRKRITSLNTLPLFFKKAAISLTLLLIGFIGISYITIRMDSSDQQKTAAGIVKEVQKNSLPPTETTEAAVTNRSDSITDSAKQKSVNFANTRGNLDLNGVYPVDLQNK